jgi:multidrug efflux pump subunit AcrB
LRKLQLESTSGRTDLGQGEQTLHLFANSHTAQDLQTLSLTLLDGRSVRLTQIAHVVDGIAQPRSQAMLDGQEVVGFEITRNKGASEIEVGSGVQQALADLKAHYPSLTFTQAFNFVKPVQEEFNGSMALLYEGALLAVVVVWAFLKNARATLIVALALPLSVIPTFAGMYCFDFTINVITLLALSLVVGILVDDAIVEVENIVRHLHMGKSAYDASMQATDEIGLAVIATTFSLIAVFLPTAFMSGISGLFFKQFGWTAALAVFASLMVARMLTPMMSAYLLKRTGQQEDSKQSMVMRYYLHTVSWCLKHRWLTLSAAGAFFISTLMLVPHLPSEFIPADDNPQTQVFVELPPGSTLAQTSQIAEQARQLVASVPYVKTIYTTIGAGSAGSDPMAPSSGEFQVHKATLTITLANRKDRPIRKQAIENHIRHALENLAGVRTKVGLGASGEKYVLVLSGDDIAALNLAAQNVERELRTLSGVGNIISTAALVRPEIELIPNTDRAADLGVTNEVIAQTLRLATLGDYDWQLAKLNLEQRQIPIVAKLTDESRKDFDVLKRLTLPSNKGMVRLEQVIDMQLTSAPAQINRYDRARNINFEIELSGLPLGEVSKAVNALPSMQHLPEGVRQISVGDAEMMGELFSSFGLAMLTGTLCILVVLILLFKDFLQPFSILAALPLSFGGSFIALLLAHKGLSMPSIIGLIMLMGIAVKNSILLVEYAIVAWRGGLSRTAALIDACHKRARPVIMTTIAMGAGMLPIALGLGETDSSFRAPMSIAVIGGLITSTLLSLLVIPVVFTVLDDTGRYLKRLFIHPSKQNDFI